MTGKLEPVIFRNETPAPTEPGWYYALPLEHKDMGIIPVELAGNGAVFFTACEIDQHPSLFRFFGPVAEVREG